MYSAATLAPAAPQGAAVRATADEKAAALARTLARLAALYPAPQPSPPPPPAIDHGPEVAATAALARAHSAFFEARAAHQARPTPATAAAHRAARAAYAAASNAWFATPAGARLLAARTAQGRPWCQLS